MGPIPGPLPSGSKYSAKSLPLKIAIQCFPGREDGSVLETKHWPEPSSGKVSAEKTPRNLDAVTLLLSNMEEISKLSILVRDFYVPGLVYVKHTVHGRVKDDVDCLV